jgi:hypothetical protein
VGFAQLGLSTAGQGSLRLLVASLWSRHASLRGRGFTGQDVRAAEECIFSSRGFPGPENQRTWTTGLAGQHFTPGAWPANAVKNCLLVPRFMLGRRARRSAEIQSWYQLLS